MSLADLFTAASVAVAAAAFAVAYRQAVEAKKTREVTGLLPLYQAHEAKGSNEAKATIRELEEDGERLKYEREKEHPETARALQVRSYISHLNFVALSVEEGLVSERYVRYVFGESIDQCYEVCKQYINDLRENEKNRDFAAGLERFAKGRLQRRRRWSFSTLGNAE